MVRLVLRKLQFLFCKVELVQNGLLRVTKFLLFGFKDCVGLNFNFKFLVFSIGVCLVS